MSRVGKIAKCRTIKVDFQMGLAIVTIERPRGILNKNALENLNKVLSDLDSRDDYQAIVVSGNKTFCNGLDYKELARMDNNQARAFSKLGQETLLKLSTSEKPTIAAVNGFAYGIGCELALACDIRVATPDSKFCLPEAKFGITPAFGGTIRLPRVIGRHAADEMIDSARKVDGIEAFQMGLIDYMIDRKNMLSEISMIVATEEIHKFNFLIEDFFEERKAFARYFEHPEIKKKLRQVVRI